MLLCNKIWHKTCLDNLKADIDKLIFTKLQNIPINLKEQSDDLHNDLVKKKPPTTITTTTKKVLNRLNYKVAGWENKVPTTSTLINKTENTIWY